MNKEYSEGNKSYLFHLFIIVTFLLFFIQVSAQTTSSNWYVDKQSSGGNTGLSWSNAWTSFSNINWSLIQPGDTVFISGGTDSLVYNEELNPNKSGAPSNYIVIRPGLEPGHNGKVIIDRQGSGSDCIMADGNQYIKYEYLSLRNATSSNIQLRTSNCIISHCDFYISSGATCGIDVRGTNNIIEYNNSNTGNQLNDGQTDFVQCTSGGGHIFRYNYIRNRNTNINEHSDCIQFWSMSTGCDIYGNYMWQDNTKTTNAQGIYIESGLGNWRIYNNIAYFPYAKHAISISSTAPAPTKVEIYGNTIYQGSGSIEQNMWTNINIGTLIIKNNIFVSEGTIMPVKISSAQTSANLIMDNNLYYTPASSSVIYYAGANRTLAYMQGLGFETNGQDVNPNFVGSPTTSEGFYLNANSPAIDAGTAISSPYNIDVLGVSRPQGNGWDIGAFEYTGAIVDITPPKLVSASLVDDFTLELSFSENIEQNSVINPLNYNINQGVVVTTVSQITSNLVRLNTTQHQPNIEYSVVVNNVYDLSGNQIDPNFNSKVYLNNVVADITQLPIVSASASNWYQDYTPNRSIDGIGGLQDPTSRWGGLLPMPDTIVYDLGESLKVSKIGISFYRWDVGRVYRYSVLLSNDLINWQPVVTSVWSQSIEWNYNEFSAITARYISLVSLENNETDYAVVYEVKIWGNDQSTDSDTETVLPKDFELSQNYPNPFNPSTNIVVKISKNTNLRLSVYDIIGNLVEEITNTQYVPGVYEFNFNANGIASGIYFYRVEAEGFVDTKKMVLLK